MEATWRGPLRAICDRISSVWDRTDRGAVGGRTGWSEPPSTLRPEMDRYSRNAPLGEPTQWSATKVSTSPSLSVHDFVCTEQSPALWALLHADENLLVHFGGKRPAASAARSAKGIKKSLPPDFLGP